MEEKEIKFLCDANCVYRAPISPRPGKIWCAHHGEFLDPQPECEMYFERR